MDAHHNRLLKVSVHEAAHAVAALVLGMPVIKAVVLPQQGYRGLVHIDRPALDGDPERVIVMRLAGRAAENHLLGVDEPHAYKGDTEAIRKDLARVIANGHGACLTPYRAAADALVRKYAQPIMDVAGMLMACGVVHGDTIADMMCRNLRYATLAKRKPPPCVRTMFNPVAKRSPPAARVGTRTLFDRSTRHA